MGPMAPSCNQLYFQHGVKEVRLEALRTVQHVCRRLKDILIHQDFSKFSYAPAELGDTANRFVTTDVFDCPASPRQAISARDDGASRPARPRPGQPTQVRPGGEGWVRAAGLVARSIIIIIRH